MTNTAVAIVGLIAAVGLLIFLVLRTKVHAVLALVIAAVIAGLAAGLTPDATIAALTAGFGSTLATIGLVIGFGVMMGRILEVSGAAEKLAITLIRLLGKGKEEWALAGAGFVISIPIFVDSAFVILAPLVRSLSRTSGRSLLTLGIALAGGLIVTHHAVPPTPGPLGAAGIFGVGIGEMILWGVVLAIPPAIAVTVYARIMGPRIEARIAADTGQPLSAHAREMDSKVEARIGGDSGEPSAKEAFAEFEELAADRERNLPSLGRSIAPIIVPILLIFINTLVSALSSAEIWVLPELAVSIASFVGNPVIALLIGVLIAIYGLARGESREQTIANLEKGVESAGIILLVTGAGGALGAVLRESGLGDTIGAWVAEQPLPSVLIPFVIASVVRLIQGSGTVAIITAASISAPILSGMPDVNLALAAQAACLGALLFSYFNDSFFWVVNRMMGVTSAKHQMLVWSVPTTIAWMVSLVMITVAGFIF